MDNKVFLVGNLTPELLYFCWKKLKTYSRNNNAIPTDYCSPISKKWFKTVPFLIAQGKFSYTRTKYNSKTLSLFRLKTTKSSIQVKNRVLENAFLFLIRPYFLNYFLFKKRTNILSECLCLIFCNINPKF